MEENGEEGESKKDNEDESQRRTENEEKADKSDRGSVTKSSGAASTLAGVEAIRDSSGLAGATKLSSLKPLLSASSLIDQIDPKPLLSAAATANRVDPKPLFSAASMVNQVDPKPLLSAAATANQVGPNPLFSTASVVNQVDPKPLLSAAATANRVNPKPLFSAANVVNQVNPKPLLSAAATANQVDPKHLFSAASIMDQVDPKPLLTAAAKLYQVHTEPFFSSAIALNQIDTKPFLSMIRASANRVDTKPFLASLSTIEDLNTSLLPTMNLAAKQVTSIPNLAETVYGIQQAKKSNSVINKTRATELTFSSAEPELYTYSESPSWAFSPIADITGLIALYTLKTSVSRDEVADLSDRQVFALCLAISLLTIYLNPALGTSLSLAFGLYPKAKEHLSD